MNKTQQIRSAITKALIATNSVLMVALPFVLLYCTYHGRLRLLILLLFSYFMLYALFLSIAKRGGERLSLLLPLTSGLLSGVSLLCQTDHLIFYYPVAVNLMLLSLFGYSLYHPPTIIERFVRLQQPTLTPFVQRYIYKVTQIWCLFFIFNGTISLVIVLMGNTRAWAWWNGVISYILIGCLLVGEWMIRRWYQSCDPHYREYEKRS